MSTAVQHASTKENRLQPRRSEKAPKSNRITRAPAALRHVSQALHRVNGSSTANALRPANGALPAPAPATAKPQQTAVPVPTLGKPLQESAPAPSKSNSFPSNPPAPPVQPNAPVATVSAFTAPTTQAESVDSVELYRREAAHSDDVRDDQEREQAYIQLRSTGASPERARALCKLGLHFVRSSAEKNRQILALLDAYGVSRSPLCWPRKELQLPCALDDCPVLGKGTFNKVLALKLEGREYAFKPFKKVAEREQEGCGISMGGITLGLREEDFHPELRNMIAVQLADALGLMGEDGIVNDACIAIVNGVPGLLTPRVHGKSMVHTNLWQESFNAHTPEGRTALWALNKDANANKRGGNASHAVQALGLAQALQAKDHVRLTGALGKRSNKAATRFESPSLNADMALAQVFIWLANLPDHHAGNILAQRSRVKLIDMDEAFAPVRTDELQFDDSEDMWLLGELPLPVAAMPASLAATLKTERCLRRIKRLLVEARDLPENDLLSLAVRLKWLLKAALPELDESQTWKVGQELDPLRSLLHRVIGFSAHEFGDSEDSESVQDDLGAPVATEVS